MYRLRLLASLGSLVCVMPNLAAAQVSSEVQALEFFVGSWSTSGEMRGEPAAAFEPVSGDETCSWAAGGYAVLCQEKVTGAGGGYEAVYVLSYDAESRRYQAYGVETPGSTMHATGRLEGDRWHWETDPAPDGSRLRYTFGPAEGGARTMVVEAGGGDEWFDVLSVTYTPAE